MSHRFSLPLQLLTVLLFVSGIALLAHYDMHVVHPFTQSQSAATALTASTTTAVATTTSVTTTKPTKAPVQKPNNTAQQSQNNASAPQATRVDNPYTTDPIDFDIINTAARAAIVNIFCTPHGGSLHPISGSGVIIDSKGIILTNAHVAQYVLLSETPQINLRCDIRTGSPATSHYRAEVLYIPKPWIDAHAADINAPRPLGTGEHDYALLQIGATTDGSVLPASFPAIQPDTREAIAFVDDSVLGASYPAEFAAGSVNSALYPVTSVTQINKLFTFVSGTVDVISIGSPIEAQSGSSGGAIINAWQRLVGIITTTSEGATTADRQLRGITLSYIDRDINAQTGASLSSLLTGDTQKKADDFTINNAPGLIEQYLPYLAQ